MMYNTDNNLVNFDLGKVNRILCGVCDKVSRELPSIIKSFTQDDIYEIIDAMVFGLDNPKLIANTIVNLLPNNWLLYDNLIVRDVKRRGIPDTDELVEALTSKGYASKDIADFIARIFDGYVLNEIEITYYELREEYKDLVIAGRSGGYWGIDYSSELEISNLFDIDKDKLIELVMSNIDKVDWADVLSDITGYFLWESGHGDLRDIVLDTGSNLCEQLFRGFELDDLIPIFTLKQEHRNYFNNVWKSITSNIEWLEDANTWVQIYEDALNGDNYIF